MFGGETADGAECIASVEKCIYVSCVVRDHQDAIDVGVVDFVELLARSPRLRCSNAFKSSSSRVCW